MKKEIKGFEEKWDELEKVAHSVDSHSIFMVGPEGTVLKQIMFEKLQEFITEKLQSQTQDIIKKIEGVKRKPTYKDSGGCVYCGYTRSGCVCQGYNQAIEDILKQLSE